MKKIITTIFLGISLISIFLPSTVSVYAIEKVNIEKEVKQFSDVYNIEEFSDENLGLTVKTYEDDDYYYQETDDTEYWAISKISKKDQTLTIIDTNLDENEVNGIYQTYSETIVEISDDSLGIQAVEPYSSWVYLDTYTGNTKIRNKTNAAILTGLSGLIAFANAPAGVFASMITAWVTTGVDTLYFRSYRYTRRRPEFALKTNSYFYSDKAMKKLVNSKTYIKTFYGD